MRSSRIYLTLKLSQKVVFGFPFGSFPKQLQNQKRKRGRKWNEKLLQSAKRAAAQNVGNWY